MSGCFFIRKPKVAVVYVHVPNDPIHEAWGMRFVESYLRCPPEADHETVVVSQKLQPSALMATVFNRLPNLTVIEHDDSGWDIGAYQFAARTFKDCGLMVFMGGSAYLKRAGWLRRMEESFEAHGDTVYGSTGNTGDIRKGIYPHVRTTGFWMSPALLNKYPHKIMENGKFPSGLGGPRGQRYEFEHGVTGLTSWIFQQAKQPWVVAFDGDYPFPSWDSIPNGFHKGDQSNVLVGDRLTMAPYYHTP